LQALDDLNVTTKLVCVRPAYGLLESRLSLSRLDLGLEEGFAVLAQVLIVLFGTSKASKLSQVSRSRASTSVVRRASLSWRRLSVYLLC
jgi:hypothetical protein